MRTTLAINEKLLDEAKALSGARSKKEAVEIALGEFIRRRKARKLLDLEGKVELSFSLKEFIGSRKKMFLIDSSAWIEYLRPNGSIKVKQRVREVLEKDEAVTCGIVVVEILRGVKDDRLFKLLRETLLSLPRIPINDEVIEKAALWGYKLDRKGKTVPTTDLFIAAAASDKAVVLHIDSDFETIASLGLRQEKLALS